MSAIACLACKTEDWSPMMVMRSSSRPTWISAPVSTLSRVMVAPFEPMILGKADRGRPVQKPTAR